MKTIRVKTNASKKCYGDPEHTIEITECQLLKIVLPKFKHMEKSFKTVDARTIMPGLKLHYRKVGEEVKMYFEEPGKGVANECNWYTADDLIDLLNF